MEIFNASVSNVAVEEMLSFCKADFHFCNIELQKRTGIIDFFESQADFESFKVIAENSFGIVSENDRSEYGDFQTNRQLAKKRYLYYTEIFNYYAKKGWSRNQFYR